MPYEGVAILGWAKALWFVLGKYTANENILNILYYFNIFNSYW